MKWTRYHGGGTCRNTRALYIIYTAFSVPSRRYTARPIIIIVVARFNTIETRVSPPLSRPQSKPFLLFVNDSQLFFSHYSVGKSNELLLYAGLVECFFEWFRKTKTSWRFPIFGDSTERDASHCSAAVHPPTLRGFRSASAGNDDDDNGGTSGRICTRGIYKCNNACAQENYEQLVILSRVLSSPASQKGLKQWTVTIGAGGALRSYRDLLSSTTAGRCRWSPPPFFFLFFKYFLSGTVDYMCVCVCV